MGIRNLFAFLANHPFIITAHAYRVSPLTLSPSSPLCLITPFHHPILAHPAELASELRGRALRITIERSINKFIGHITNPFQKVEMRANPPLVYMQQ